jgi:hypothetical protein
MSGQGIGFKEWNMKKGFLKNFLRQSVESDEICWESAGNLADIRRTFGEHSPNIRRTFAEYKHSQKFGEYSPNIRRTFAEYSPKLAASGDSLISANVCIR